MWYIKLECAPNANLITNFKKQDYDFYNELYIGTLLKVCDAQITQFEVILMLWDNLKEGSEHETFQYFSVSQFSMSYH